MSDKDESSVQLGYVIGKLVVGIGLLFVVSILFERWESQRAGILETTETPGIMVYLLIPILVPVLIVGATLAIQSFFVIGNAMFTSARARNIE